MYIFFYPAFVLFLCGIFLGIQKTVFADNGLVLMALFFLFGVILFYLLRKLKSYGLFFVIIFFFLGLVCSFGADDSRNCVEHYYYKNVTVVGRIDPASIKKYEYGNSCLLQCLQFSSGNSSHDFVCNIRINSKDTLPVFGIIKCRGILTPLSVYRNSGSFDMEGWNRVHKNAGRIRRAQVEKLGYEDVSLSWVRVKWLQFNDYLDLFGLKLRGIFSNLVPGDGGILLGNMIFGGSNGISDETREIFSANGLSHLLAVSGTHLMLLAAFVRLLTGPLRNWECGRRNKKLCGINKDGEIIENSKAVFRGILYTDFFVLGILVLYALICGFKPPVLRALIMAMILVLPEGYRADRCRALCLAAMVLLICNPLWILDIGFQLSFAAALGLVLFAPRLRNYFYLCFPKIIAESLTITAAAQLAVLPFLLFYFHQISLLSFFSTIFFVPVLEIACLLALTGSVVYGFLNVTFFIEVAGFLLMQVLHWADLLAGLPWGVLYVGGWQWWLGVIYYLLLALKLNIPCVQGWGLYKRAVLLTAGSMFFLFWVILTNFSSGPFSVYFLDVGQGDCAVVVTPERKTMVIDTGGVMGMDIGSKVIAPFLRDKGIGEIDILLLSHGDLDHAGGSAGLARNIPVKKIVFPLADLTQAEKQLLDCAGSAEIIYARAGMTFGLDGAFLSILDAPEGNADNSVSVVNDIQYQGHGILFTGDIDSDREGELVLNRSYDVIKVPHHGSKYSNSEDFYAQVHPKIAVISVGRDNGYGHPHDETLESIGAVGCRIYRTDTMGMVSVMFDKDSFVVETAAE